MPELPEVETVKEKLKERLIHRRIKDVNIFWDKIIQFPSRDEFINKIKNQAINDIKRRGKWLILELDNHYLLIHLRMEGKFFFKSGDEPRIKHEHVIFVLDNNIELRYHDTRKFGKMYLIDKDKLYTSKPLNKLGLEPFDDNLTVKYLQNKFSKKSIPIKTSLLDQHIIVGSFI
jgi:formamidopyrimidine-DNA glycosylase